jgi:hypothetical protein
MTDPEIDHEEQRAATELARRLRPWASGMQGPELFAAAFIADLRREGWRPPLRPAPPQQAPADRDTTARGAAEARALLAETLRKDHT